MWSRFKSYFLEAFRTHSGADLKKAFYLLMSTLTVLGFFLFLFISHLFFLNGPMYIISDIIGVVGTMFAVYQFRRGSIESAGKVLIGVIIAVFTVQTVLTDLTRTDPAIRYRIYETLVCILGCLFLFISFFREVRLIVYFAGLFIAILTLHYFIIRHQIGDNPEFSLFAFEHYVVTVISVIFASIITSILITLIEKLYTQATRQGEVIRRQNEELQKTVDEQTRFLVSSNESLKEFAYLTSHDLREPLRNISGFITLIKKQCDAQEIVTNREDIEEYFRYVQKGVSQMELLINDIKLYSGINVIEKNFTRVPMGDLLYQVRDALEADIDATGATLHMQVGMPVINADRTLLFSLMQNLIVNAIKYRKPDVPAVIEIRYDNSKGGHTFSVSDNGIGIDKNYFDRIFHAFKRLHGKDSEYEGTGLGLAICKKIVEIHGGRIWVESTEGEGSTFYFTLK